MLIREPPSTRPRTPDEPGGEALRRLGRVVCRPMCEQRAWPVASDAPPEARFLPRGRDKSPHRRPQDADGGPTRAHPPPPWPSSSEAGRPRCPLEGPRPHGRRAPAARCPPPNLRGHGDAAGRPLSRSPAGGHEQEQPLPSGHQTVGRPRAPHVPARPEPPVRATSGLGATSVDEPSRPATQARKQGAATARHAREEQVPQRRRCGRRRVQHRSWERPPAHASLGPFDGIECAEHSTSRARADMTPTALRATGAWVVSSRAVRGATRKRAYRSGQGSKEVDGSLRRPQPQRRRHPGPRVPARRRTPPLVRYGLGAAPGRSSDRVDLERRCEDRSSDVIGTAHPPSRRQRHPARRAEPTPQWRDTQRAPTFRASTRGYPPPRRTGAAVATIAHGCGELPHSDASASARPRHRPPARPHRE